MAELHRRNGKFHRIAIRVPAAIGTRKCLLEGPYLGRHAPPLTWYRQTTQPAPQD
ncbi:MAG: hypothetical protein K0U70_15580 [Actinomycetia bacterium]|nr:hypothetical protein [Actinomycetes bacterium]